jgi:HK97 family phage major capsid protein
MNEQIKRLYDEANQFHAQAKGILAEFEGKAMPAEKAQEVDRLLDQVDAKTAEAKRVERVEQFNVMDTTPAKQLDFGETHQQGKGSFGVSDDMKEMARRAGYKDALVFASDEDVKYSLAMAKLWKDGKDALSAEERKALATAPGTAGGFLVGDTYTGRFIEGLGDVVVMRQIATVLPPIAGGSSVTPSEDSELSDAKWTSEVGTGSDDTVEPFGDRKLTPHPLAKRIKISRTILRASNLANVEQYVLNRLAKKHAVPEENAFINGNGVNKPLGLLEAGISTVSTATSNTLAADDLINWAYSLPAGYGRTAKILCNSSLIRKIRLMKGTDNNYLWQPGLAQGSPNKILDWEYVQSDKYPTGLTSDAFDDNAIVATIGDFAYFWIQDSLNFSIQRLDELYAENNQVGFIGRKETDGMPVLTEAFVNLKIKA